jgi:hypothetical protein
MPHTILRGHRVARAVPVARSAAGLDQRGTAWAASTGKLRGTFQAQRRSGDCGLMVLSRTASGWEIRAIHWSLR